MVEKINARLDADQAYHALAAKAGDAFLDGTTPDTLMQSLTRPRFEALIEKVPHLRAHLDRVARERLAPLAPAPSHPE